MLLHFPKIACLENFQKRNKEIFEEFFWQRCLAIYCHKQSLSDQFTNDFSEDNILFVEWPLRDDTEITALVIFNGTNRFSLVFDDPASRHFWPAPIVSSFYKVHLHHHLYSNRIHLLSSSQKI